MYRVQITGRTYRYLRTVCPFSLTKCFLRLSANKLTPERVIAPNDPKMVQSTGLPVIHKFTVGMSQRVIYICLHHFHHMLQCSDSLPDVLVRSLLAACLDVGLLLVRVGEVCGDPDLVPDDLGLHPDLGLHLRLHLPHQRLQLRLLRLQR